MTIKELTIGQTIFVVQGFKVWKYKVHTIEAHKEKQLRIVSLFDPETGRETEKTLSRISSTKMVVEPRYGSATVGFISEEKANREALKRATKEYLRLKDKAMECLVQANDFFENYISKIHVKPDEL